MISKEEYDLKFNKKENMVNAYNEFINLKKESLEKSEIVDILVRKYHVSKNSVYYWSYNKSPSCVKIKEGRELFYVIGAILGDGCIYHWRNIYRINLVGDEEFTNKYAKKLSICLNKPVKTYCKLNRNYWYVNISNVELFFIIKRIRENINILSEMMSEGNMSENAIQFIEGFFDAEGCVKVVKEQCRKMPKICLDITNTNLSFLELVKKLLREHLNIIANYSIQKINPAWKSNNKKVAYHLRIYKKEYVKIFFENISTTKLKKEKKFYLDNWLAGKRSF